MQLSQKLLNQYQLDRKTKELAYKKEKKLERLANIALDLKKEKFSKEKEYQILSQITSHQIEKISRERNITNDEKVKKEIIESINLSNKKVKALENEIKDLIKISDANNNEIKKLIYELDKINHMSRASWDEWNYRKRAFNVASMEDLYGKV